MFTWLKSRFKRFNFRDQVIDLDGGTWIGLFSWIALSRFALGLPVDSTLYLGVLSAYVIGSNAKRMIEK